MRYLIYLPKQLVDHAGIGRAENLVQKSMEQNLNAVVICIYQKKILVTLQKNKKWLFPSLSP